MSIYRDMMWELFAIYIPVVPFEIEEINVVAPGENYGWSYFEGRYLVNGPAFEVAEEPVLPPIFFPVNFPVADYDYQKPTKSDQERSC
jgi:hypothetical protein